MASDDRPSTRSRADLRAGQLVALHRLLGRIVPANPFQRRRLAAAGLEAGSLKDLQDFYTRAPFTTKPELARDQEEHPPFGSNLTHPLEAYTRLHQTSGTSGRPLRWLDTPESWEWLLGNWAEVYRAADVTRADRVYFAFSFGPFIGFWMAFEAAEALGLLCIPGGGQSTVGRLRGILDLEATVLCCTPTYALHLAEMATREGMNLGHSKVRRIIVAGEPGGSIPATRARLEAAWPGARVVDHHGMTEVGPVTYECPARPGRLHLIETGYLAEIIDPATGAPSRGQPGELVLTTLGRTGSPLLRYRTGDLVRPVFAPEAENTQPCACGRYELALEGGILGRVDDMVIVRGVNVFPGAVEAVIRRFPEVAEYQVAIRDTGGLTE
ncbi:MAG: AMP-binding protein, partial [Verrucomicrobiae bacterium]|nr:AMP-binding protein [Verrucomicrobiae bacterium]